VTTLPRHALDHAKARPARVAFRRKVLGIWEETTYSEYVQRASRVGAGLAKLGVGPGDRICIVSHSRPEWLFVDIGAQGIGAAVAAVPPAAPEDDVRHVLETSEAVVAVVENELQLDKLLAVRSSLPQLRHIVVIDSPMVTGDDRGLLSLADLERDAPVDALDEWEERVARLDPTTVAAIVHTAGSTGPPRELSLSHEVLVAAGRTVGDAFSLQERDEVLSGLPLSHVANRVVSGSAALLAGAAVHFGEGGPSFSAELREVQPTVFLAPPRVWEQLYAGAEMGARHARHIKRTAYRFGTHRHRTAIARAIAWLVARRSIRAKLGMARARVALSAGAAIAPQITAWFRGIGVPALESYGPAEAAGFVSLRPGGVLPGVEARVDEGGEVLVRTPFVAIGVAGDDGWIHTGDLGAVEPAGEIIITGRRADLIELQDGTRIAPAPIEAQLKASPFVGDVVLVGHGRSHLAALVGINPVTVSDWLAREGQLTASVEEMVARRDVAELIDHAIDQLNAHVAAAQRIHDFRLLPAELDEESGMRTAAYQIRRHAVISRYHELVDAMYENIAQVASQ
jgi:long-chain acyl-CoA synthetase